MLVDGQWQFRLDPKSEGVAGRWFSAEVSYPETIKVPGNWQAQGFGPPGGIAKHNYQGKAWYRLALDVPEDWVGRRVWLRFEGVCNWGDVYIDATKVGRVDSFVTPYEFDVTEQVTFGKQHQLSVLVDSGTLPAAPYKGMMQFLVPVGGITSHVWLESRPEPRLGRIWLRPEPGLKAVLASVSAVRRQTSAPWSGRCRVRVLNGLSRFDIVAEGEVALAISKDARTSGLAELRIPFAGLRPWTPDEPRLYQVEVVLLDAAGPRDAQTIRTGFRTLVTDTATGNFLLNGRPLFVRGCGYDSLEPIHGSPPSDKAVYVERLRLLKSYGFNAVRFLAHTPLREFFEAADDVGMLMQTEGEWFLGGTPMQSGTARLMAAQVPRMIEEFGNHPSWYSFSCFNEAFGGQDDPVKQDYIHSAFASFRAMKPDHYFVASDGGGDLWPTDIITDVGVMGRADLPDETRSALPRQIFRGRTADVALFHRALSDAELRALSDGRTKTAAQPQVVRQLKPAVYWPAETPPPGILRTGEAAKALPRRGGALTVSAWVRPDGFASGDWGTFFSCGAAELGRALIFCLDGETGDGRLVVGRYNGNILKSHRALVAREWNHVALSYDGRRIRLWVNGQADAELEALLDIPQHDLAIGRLIEQVLRNPADYRSRPRVWHEFDNTYIAPLPDLEIEKRLTGLQTQAWVIEPHQRRVEGYRLLGRYDELRRLSIAHYRQYVKQAFERARAPAAAGRLRLVGRQRHSRRRGDRRHLLWRAGHALPAREIRPGLVPAAQPRVGVADRRRHRPAGAGCGRAEDGPCLALTLRCYATPAGQACLEARRRQTRLERGVHRRAGGQARNHCNFGPDCAGPAGRPPATESSLVGGTPLGCLAAIERMAVLGFSDEEGRSARRPALPISPANGGWTPATSQTWGCGAPTVPGARPGQPGHTRVAGLAEAGGAGHPSGRERECLASNSPRRTFWALFRCCPGPRYDGNPAG